jgi:4-amino-4-deoxy-L-arabinose transferase-like glycosyltransferase
MEKNLKEITKMRLWLGVLIFLAMTLPWFIALWHQAGTEYLKVFFIHNHLQRFLPGSLAGALSDAASGHHHPFYYYLTEFPNGFLPWGILLIPVFFNAFTKSKKSMGPSDPLSEKGTLFAKCWFFAGIIFLSVASTKRTLYLIPIFAPIAMLTASYIDTTLTAQSMNRIGKVFVYLFNIVVFIGGLLLIPAYFYYKKLYFVDADPWLFMSTLFVSAVMMLLSLMAIRYLWLSHLKRYWISMNLSVVVALLFVAAIAMPVIDHTKSFVPFCREISAMVPSAEPLYTYHADETFRGAVPFYTGRYLVELSGISDKYLQRETPYFVMIRDKKEQLEKELLNTGKLFPVVRQEMGTNRMLVLFSNVPEQKTITVGGFLKSVKKDDSTVRATQ